MRTAGSIAGIESRLESARLFAEDVLCIILALRYLAILRRFGKETGTQCRIAVPQINVSCSRMIPRVFCCCFLLGLVNLRAQDKPAVPVSVLDLALEPARLNTS